MPLWPESKMLARSGMSVGGGLASYSTLLSAPATSVAVGAEIDAVDAGAEIDDVK